MVIRELFITKSDGTKLYRTYSDQGLMLLQVETGITYSEAIDPENVDRTYKETNIPIETEEDEDNIESGNIDNEKINI